MVGDFNPILDGGEFDILTLVPSEGGTKKWKIQKLILEPKSQNMICCRHKNKTKSKRWALNLENWASYGYFLEPSRGEISISSNFQISKSQPNFEISTRFFSCELIFDIGLTSI